MKNNFLTIKILKIIAIVMLFIALADNPYGYYQILRWVVAGVAGYSAYLAYKDKNKLWTWIFGIVAVLFNPIAPIYLDRETWSVINIIVAGIFLVDIIKNHSNKSRFE
jgi:uncharacterized membrane protein